jgi:hypothetical protein
MPFFRGHLGIFSKGEMQLYQGEQNGVAGTRTYMVHFANPAFDPETLQMDDEYVYVNATDPGETETVETVQRLPNGSLGIVNTVVTKLTGAMGVTRQQYDANQEFD